MRRLNWRRAVGWILAVAVIIFLGQVLVSSWGQIVASGFVFKFDWPALVLSVVLLVLGRAMATESWRRVLLALGESLSYRVALYFWYVSNLVRYVPGNVWQVATLMVLSEREGVSKTNALLSQAVYSVIALSMAGLFGLWLLPVPNQYQPYILVLLLAVVLTLAQPRVFRLIVRLSRWSLDKMKARLPRGQGAASGGPAPAAHAGPTLTFAGLLLTPLASCAMWTFNGIAFFLFVRSLSPLSLNQLPAFIAIYSAAYFVGYVSFITPSGLGFREGAMALLLAPYLPMSIAVAIAFAARIWMTISEFLGLGLAALLVPRGHLPPLPFNMVRRTGKVSTVADSPEFLNPPPPAGSEGRE